MKTAKRLLAAVLALVMMASMAVVASAEAEVGYYDPSMGNAAVEIVVPAGGTNYLNAYGADGYLATITGIAGLGFQHAGEGLTFRMDGQEYPLTLVGDPMMRGMAQVTFTNNNGYDVTVKVAISNNASVAAGTSNNPEVIEEMNWFMAEVTQEAGNMEGYFYTYTAPADGEIVAYFTEQPENYLCDIIMTNMNTYAQRTLSADGIDNYGMELHMEVKEGHEVQIVIAAIRDAEGNYYPAATMAWCGNFAYPMGSEKNPINIEWGWNDAYTTASATVTVAAGETVYYSGYGNMILTVNGVETEMTEEGVFALTNTTAAEATYELVMATPVGEYSNPEIIEINGTYTDTNNLGENEAYYYSWTVTEDATVTLTVTEGANITADVQTYVEDSEWPISEQFALAEPEVDENWNNVGWIVAEKLELQVTAGQIVFLEVTGLTDWTTWTTPAIEYTLTIDVEVAAVLEGWVKENGKWFFYENGEMVKNAWRKDSKGWVYLGQDGAMLVNSWCKDSKGWCYVGADGYAVTNCWKKDSKGWVYLDGNGSMVYNKWVKDSKGWCHVGSNGYMEYNKWVKDSKGWCYVGSDGYMVTNNWAKDSKGWCFMGANGYIVYNDLIVDYGKGKIYHVDASGYMVSNKWIGSGNEWIYFGSDGALAVNKWVKDGGKWYYMGEDGLMLYSCSKKIGNKTYYFNASGVCTNP